MPVNDDGSKTPNRSQIKTGGSADLTTPGQTGLKYGDTVNNDNPGNPTIQQRSGPNTYQMGNITLNAVDAENIAFLTFRQRTGNLSGPTHTFRIREVNSTNGNIIASVVNSGGNITLSGTKVNQAVGNVTYYFSIQLTATNPQAPSSFHTYLQGLPNGMGWIASLDDTHEGKVKN